jgi:hypothetical protein
MLEQGDFMVGQEGEVTASEHAGRKMPHNRSPAANKSDAVGVDIGA